MATKIDTWCSFLSLLLFQIVSCAVDVHKEYLERYPKCGTLEGEGPARIVNGYSVKQKIPWVVHMGKMGCTGSLLTPEHVLTAAHCMSIFHDPPYSIQERKVIKLGKKELLVQVGLWSKGDDTQKIPASYVEIHEKFFQENKQGRFEDWDIALVTLRRTSHETTMCLPSGKISPKDRQTDYPVGAMGWGQLKGQFGDARSKAGCFTNEFSQQPYQLCDEEGCITGDYPEKEYCESFIKNTMEGSPGRSAVVVIERRRGNIYCPNLNYKSEWSKFGYCHQKTVQGGGGGGGGKEWGFCSPSCSGGSPNTLQNVTLFVMSKETCKKYGSNTVQGKELCAMGKMYTPHSMHFSEDGAFKAEHQRKYTSYGYRDTCIGDSGGPLFTVIYRRGDNYTNRYVQIGITSRGPRACGQLLGGKDKHGNPTKTGVGVYTYVPVYREWIWQRIKHAKEHSGAKRRKDTQLAANFLQWLAAVIVLYYYP